MPSLANISIRYKLAAATLVTSTVTATAAIAVLGFYGVSAYKDALGKEVATLASVVASNTSAALAFEDPGAASEILAALERSPEIIAARLLDAEGETFAAYRRAGSDVQAIGLTLDAPGSRFLEDRLLHLQEVRLGERRLGSLAIESSLEGVQARIRRATTIGAVAFGIALALAASLALVFHRLISAPILKLAALVRGISRDNDYTVRADGESGDEVGALVRGVNEMLTAIQERDAEIAAHTDSLLKKAFDELEVKNETLKGEIAERRRAEAELTSKAARLLASNRELEEFAYVASHDLQEPLRKVQAFGERLRSTAGEGLCEKSSLYLERMEDAAGRMGRLIDDLLTFSRVTSKRSAFLPTSLKSVLRGVLSDLEVRIDESKAEIELGDLPTLDADPTQMQQLFQNLVGNSLKFHRPDTPPVVSIDAEIFSGEELPRELAALRPCKEGYACITVRDNGIGFEPQYADRIFTVFQRLHGRKEYAGTGVGLAVCRKIVERHGGCIIAEGHAGEGAEFRLVLPLTQAAEPTEDSTTNEEAAQATTQPPAEPASTVEEQRHA